MTSSSVLSGSHDPFAQMFDQSYDLLSDGQEKVLLKYEEGEFKIHRQGNSESVKVLWIEVPNGQGAAQNYFRFLADRYQGDELKQKVIETASKVLDLFAKTATFTGARDFKEAEITAKYNGNLHDRDFKVVSFNSAVSSSDGKYTKSADEALIREGGLALEIAKKVEGIFGTKDEDEKVDLPFKALTPTSHLEPSIVANMHRDDDQEENDDDALRPLFLNDDSNFYTRLSHPSSHKSSDDQASLDNESFKNSSSRMDQAYLTQLLEEEDELLMSPAIESQPAHSNLTAIMQEPSVATSQLELNLPLNSNQTEKASETRQMITSYLSKTIPDSTNWKATIENMALLSIPEVKTLPLFIDHRVFGNRSADDAKAFFVRMFLGSLGEDVAKLQDPKVADKSKQDIRNQFVDKLNIITSSPIWHELQLACIIGLREVLPETDQSKIPNYASSKEDPEGKIQLPEDFFAGKQLKTPATIASDSSALIRAKLELSDEFLTLWRAATLEAYKDIAG